MSPARKAASLSRIAREDRGTAVVEFAMVLPVLVFLLSGIADFGSLVVQSMQVSTAAQAGARYAQINGWNAAGIQTAATNATPLSGLDARPTAQSACIAGSSVVAASGGACAGAEGSTPAGTYVTVSVRAPFAPVTSLWKAVLPTTVSSSAIVRIS